MRGAGDGGGAFAAGRPGEGKMGEGRGLGVRDVEDAQGVGWCGSNEVGAGLFGGADMSFWVGFCVCVCFLTGFRTFHGYISEGRGDVVN